MLYGIRLRAPWRARSLPQDLTLAGGQRAAARARNESFSQAFI